MKDGLKDGCLINEDFYVQLCYQTGILTMDGGIVFK